MRNLVLLFSFAAIAAWGQSRAVAITFDDLPRGGDGGGRDVESVRRMTVKLLDSLHGVPVTAFVNAGRAEEMGGAGLQSILRIWLDHGAELGNHTYTHPDLNTTPLADYEANVVRGEAALIEATGRRPRYFRHPFLHAGPDAATRHGLEKFLKERGYQIAPVTFDNSDWMFARVYRSALDSGDEALAARVRNEYLPYMESIVAFFEGRSVEVVGREFPQILLVHASQLNADSMPAMLAMFKRRGYRFVSLEEALKDDAYRLPDEYYGKGGFSWIHRWSKTKGMAPKGEPDEPDWINAEYKKLGK